MPYKNPLSGIYAIVNRINGRMYVGRSECIQERFKTHLKELDRGIHHCQYLQNAWNKYGKANFTFITLEYWPVEMLKQAEQRWLDRHGELRLYNLSLVSEGGGHPHTEKSKARLSKSLMGNQNGKGHPQSAEAKALASARMKGNTNHKFVRDAEWRAKISAAAKGNQRAKGYKQSHCL